MKKRFFSLFALSFMIPKGLAVDESRLWLPSAYSNLYIDLLEATHSANSVKKCSKVLSATIDLDQSTKQRPVFRILCRKVNGKTYNEMVDGVTKKTLTTLQGDEAVLNTEALQALRKKEGDSRKVQAINKQIDLFWLVCEAAFSRRTSLMNKVEKLIDGDQIDPLEYRQEQLTFRFNFNAEDPSGASLQYVATCVIRSAKDYELNIRSRRVSG